MRKLLLPFTLAAMLAIPVSGNIVFEFNSADYVTTNVNLPGSWSAGLPFSEAVAITPTSNYGGPELFGGFSANTGAANTFTVARVNNNNSAPGAAINTDFLLVRLNFTDATTGGSVGLLLLGDTPNVSFDAASSITLAGNRFSGSGHTGDIRAVIQAGGSYFISDSSINLPAGFTSGLTLNNLHTLSWSSYTPGTSLYYASAPATVDLTGITRVGVLLTGNIPASGATGNKDLIVGSLVVNAIPEPSTYAMLLGAATLLVVALRRRRR